MRLHLFCVARRPSAWAAEGAGEYLKRLTGALDLRCRDFAPQANAGSVDLQRERESDLLLKAVPKGALLVVLDERGSSWSTRQLARHLEQWRTDAREVVLAVGGAEGHAPRLREAAGALWSLSALTLPHALVRVVVLEQIYRAWSLLNNHPYHRE